LDMMTVPCRALASEGVGTHELRTQRSKGARTGNPSVMKERANGYAHVEEHPGTPLG